MVILGLVEQARVAGIDAHIVEVETFDELFGDLLRFLPETEREIGGIAGSTHPRLAKIAIRPSHANVPAIRTNAQPIIIARSLSIYQRKHAGEHPKRVVIQKNTEFKPQEVDGCFDALMHTPNVELVHVQQSSGWSGIQIAEPRKPHAYPCRRGTSFQIGDYENLLWTQGNLPEVTANGRTDFFKEGRGTPEPLLLVRYAGTGSMDDVCREVLGLTKMDWNNDGPYDRLPVTLSFAQMLAKVVILARLKKRRAGLTSRRRSPLLRLSLTSTRFISVRPSIAVQPCINSTPASPCLWKCELQNFNSTRQFPKAPSIQYPPSEQITANLSRNYICGHFHFGKSTQGTQVILPSGALL